MSTYPTLPLTPTPPSRNIQVNKSSEHGNISQVANLSDNQNFNAHKNSSTTFSAHPTQNYEIIGQQSATKPYTMDPNIHNPTHTEHNNTLKLALDPVSSNIQIPAYFNNPFSMDLDQPTSPEFDNEPKFQNYSRRRSEFNKHGRGPSIGFEDLEYNVNLRDSEMPIVENSVHSPYTQEAVDAKAISTPLPKNIAPTPVYESSNALSIYFVQKEGHIVAPQNMATLRVFKCILSNNNNVISSDQPSSFSGMAQGASFLLKVDDVWRLGLHKDRSYIVKGLQNELVIYDESTSPARCVILKYSKEISKSERLRLEILLKSTTKFIEEPPNLFEVVENGLETVYDSLSSTLENVSQKMNSDLHKKTKWLRKSTDKVVRLGGNIVSKGLHIVTDNVIERNMPKGSSSEHKFLFESLKKFRDSCEKNRIDYI